MGSEYAGRHPGVKDIMKYLEPNPRLEGTQAEIAVDCYDLSKMILDHVSEDSPELTAGLRKLLEAKDCFVRASLNL